MGSIRNLKEDEMFEPFTVYLRDQGYKIEETNKGYQSGPDVVASKDGSRLVVEMKGHTANLTTDIRTCVGQICGQMEEGVDEYGLALAGSYRNHVEDYFYALQKLDVSVFIVSKDGVEPWETGN